MIKRGLNSFSYYCLVLLGAVIALRSKRSQNPQLLENTPNVYVLRLVLSTL